MSRFETAAARYDVRRQCAPAPVCTDTTAPQEVASVQEHPAWKSPTRRGVLSPQPTNHFTAPDTSSHRHKETSRPVSIRGAERSLNRRPVSRRTHSNPEYAARSAARRGSRRCGTCAVRVDGDRWISHGRCRRRVPRAPELAEMPRSGGPVRASPRHHRCGHWTPRGI